MGTAASPEPIAPTEDFVAGLHGVAGGPGWKRYESAERQNQDADKGRGRPCDSLHDAPP